MNPADRPVNRPINRIGATFTALKAQGRTGLIPYVTAGDPDPAGTVALLHALAGAGADLIELGVPFSDPMADGPVIQRAVERALARGVGLRRVLAMVAEFRREDARTPVILMGYANPLERMGVVEFARQAQAAGVDGVLTVDLPPEESGALVDALAAQGVAPIFLLAPTTPAARTAAIIERAAGFLYYVSLKGVTGADTLDLASVAEHLGALRRLTALPLGVGFGVRDPETAARVAGVADAVVVGSRLVRELEQHPAGDAPRVAGDLMRAFRAAIDEADHVQCAG